MPNSNPFFHRGPINDPSYFYNRKMEIGRCLHLLQTGTSISIIGPRKIGKTSLLFHLINPDALQAFSLSMKNCLLVYLDCAGLYELTVKELYELILEEINEKLTAQGLSIPYILSDTRTAYSDFVRSIKLITKTHRLILILDEFEGLSANPHFDQTFFAGLRAMSIAHDVAFITASKTSLANLTSAHQNSLLSSNFFNIFSTLYLTLFSDDEAMHFIAQSLLDTDVRFDDETVAWIRHISGGHPFFLQIVADCTYEKKVQNLENPLTIADFHLLERCITKEAIGHFKYYWECLTSDEKYTLKTLSKTGSDDTQEAHYSLKEQCLIKEVETGFTYFSPLFGTYVLQQEVAELFQAGPLLIDKHRQDVFLRGNLLELTELLYDLLLYLVQAEGRVVSREELDREVWHPDEVVGGEERVKAGIKSLRQSLGKDKKCIVNRRGKGYTFLPFPA